MKTCSWTYFLWLNEGATMNDIIARLWQRTVLPGYTFHTSVPGKVALVYIRGTCTLYMYMILAVTQVTIQIVSTCMYMYMQYYTLF